MTPRNLLKILIPMAVIPVLYLVIYLLNNPEPRFYLNLSNSEPVGLYQKIPFEGCLNIGELVFMEVPAGSRPYIYGRGWLPKGWPLLKNVGALVGDRVTISNEAVTINDSYAGPVYETDRNGAPLPRLRGEMYIPAAHFFPIAFFT